MGSSSRIPPAPSHGLREVEEYILWTQGPLKCLESQPGSFLVPRELDHQESPGTEALWERMLKIEQGGCCTMEMSSQGGGGFINFWTLVGL